ncbi:hypothetical protein [Aureimonas ureilytica]|uniref:hypothetical protein n=1 Tax=Aureimonas ureilytica TaxID=401562 RepID=UPI000381F205|nr:hypothetical protein [Aureimonas ureilytica]
MSEAGASAAGPQPANTPDPSALLSQYRSEIRFEGEILSARLSAYLTAQSFLVIAYASSMAAGWSKPGLFTLLVPLPLSILGFVLSVDAWASLRASAGEIEAWHRRQQELIDRHRALAPFWPVERADSPLDPTLDLRFRQGARFALHTPWIFGFTWTYLFGVAIFLWVWKP